MVQERKSIEIPIKKDLRQEKYEEYLIKLGQCNIYFLACRSIGYLSASLHLSVQKSCQALAT
jgi:hypothetical protein